MASVIGLVQIGEVVVSQRSTRQFHMVRGALLPRTSANGESAALAFLPHAAGLLQAYVQGHAREPDRYVFLRPLYRRLPVAEAVEQLREAAVVGFSTYVWNVRLSLAIAKGLKQANPDVLVVFGGPQAPDEAEGFLREHRQVDVVCHGEGERTFLEVLENRDGRRWGEVASVSYLDEAVRFVRTPRRSRMTDLDEIPSPYLEGVFDELMRSAPGQLWLVTWETNRGCPFSCTFCDWGSATASNVFRYGMERLGRELAWFASRGIKHLFICDANFGILPRDVEIAEMIAAVWQGRSSGVTVSIQNTKNRTERSEQIHRILKKCLSVSIGANVSLQTVAPAALKAIRRDNISQEALERLHKFFAEDGRDCYTELIIGLAGETYASFADGVAQVIRKGQYNRILFYECSVLPNAEMAQSEYRRLHGIEHVPVRIVHPYEGLGWGNRDEIPEYIDIVISTRAMNREDWLRTRVFTLLVELLFYDRLLQVPMTVLGAGLGLDYRRMIEAFQDAAASEFPTLAAARRIFENYARDLQQGRTAQFLASPEWLNIWWPIDQYALISLVRGGQLDVFYTESRKVLARFAEAEGAELDPVLLDDVIRFNQAMLALPFQWADVVVELTYAVDEFYHDLITGRPAFLERRPCRCRIERSAAIWLSWEDWLEDLIHRAYVRRAYNSPVTPLGDHEPSRASASRPAASSLEILRCATVGTAMGLVQDDLSSGGKEKY